MHNFYDYDMQLYKKSNLIKIELHIFFFILRLDYNELKKN